MIFSLPKRGRGKQTEAAEAAYQAEVKRFFDAVKAINDTLPFKISSRGWCYVLENQGVITKTEFKTTQDLINFGRKNGYLPIDFVEEDNSRGFSCLEHVDSNSVIEERECILSRILNAHRYYKPLSFWDYQTCYIQLFVEKIDLKSLFEPLCREYKIPIANAKGWSDINSRAELIKRFNEWEQKGKQPVLLYCGDHDPAGLNISNLIKSNLDDLTKATGWTSANLTVDRFGLNYDFIVKNKLSWIDNLETSSGGDLSDKKHKHHNCDYVQSYIKAYGARKVEANALVTNLEAGRALFESTLDKYLDYSAIDRYENDIFTMQSEVAELVKTAFKPEVLNEIAE